MDNFGNKDYGDYFKALEQQLNSEDAKPRSVAKEPAKKRVEKRKRRRFILFRLRKSVLAVIALVLIGVIALSVLGGKKEAPNDTASQVDTVKEKEEKPFRVSYTANSETVGLPSENDAQTAIIVDKTTNTVVAQRNAHKRAYPASTTKIMTLLVAVENITDFNDTFKMTLDITDPLFEEGASVAGFLNGETITMTDLLYGTILPSGADAAMGLAIKIAGSEEEFVKLMNKKVKELGLKNTNFTNVTGLHNENNYSTAYDMAVILDAALENEICKKVLSTYQHTTSITPQHPEGILLSSTLFNYMYGTEPETATILGGKTGFVNESGYCIASYGENNTTGNEYIVVTLGNSARMPAFFGQIDLYKEFAK